MSNQKVYYTIGEVSEMLDLKKHVIRYWEKEFSQLRPYKKNNRNRLYNETNIKMLERIKEMLYVQRLTIEGAKKILKEKDKKDVPTENEDIEFYKRKIEYYQNKIRKIKNFVKKEMMKKDD